MGILSSGKGKEPTSATGKGSSRTMDFSKLPPLKSGGTVGFTNFRDNTEASSGANKARKKSNGSMKVNGDDSDDDEDEDIKIKEEVDMDDKDESMKTLLSPEESEFRGQLAEGLNRIKVCFIFFQFSLDLLPFPTSFQRLEKRTYLLLLTHSNSSSVNVLPTTI